MNKKILIGVSLASALSLIAADLYTSRNDCLLRDGTAGTILELSMGDWSCDGHCIEKTRTICSNLSQEEIGLAYQSATEKMPFDFRNDVAADYEDSSLPADKLKLLRENGIATWAFEEESQLEEGEVLESVGLNEDTYSEIYLQLVKLGNPNFKQETLKGKSLRIGGYGLFSL
jgi:hypothetical protein